MASVIIMVMIILVIISIVHLIMNGIKIIILNIITNLIIVALCLLPTECPLMALYLQGTETRNHMRRTTVLATAASSAWQRWPGRGMHHSARLSRQ